MGVPIVGTREDIEKNIKKYEVDEIVIAMPSADLQTTREIIRVCQGDKKAGEDSSGRGKEPDDFPQQRDQACQL